MKFNRTISYADADCFVVIILPIALVARITISMRQKVGLFSVLSLGLLVIAFSIARIVVTDTQGIHPEISWLALWSAAESSVAVMVCCLASFKTLYTAQRTGSTTRQRSTGGSSGRIGDNSHSSARRGFQLEALDPYHGRSVVLTSINAVESTTTREPKKKPSTSQFAILDDAAEMGSTQVLDRNSSIRRRD